MLENELWRVLLVSPDTVISSTGFAVVEELLCWALTRVLALTTLSVSQEVRIKRFCSPGS